jgi:hypothetical protein
VNLADYPKVVHDVRHGIAHVTGSSLIGLYLYGSLATGDFEPGVSDIDLIAVLRSVPDAALVARLGEMHARIVRASPEWDERVEVAYVSARGLSECRTHTTVIARISPGEPLHTLEAGRDFLLDWYSARARSIVLLGPPIESLIPPIPSAEYLAEVRSHLAASDRWIDDDAHPASQAYAILTVARGLYTLRMGDRPSKREAASWAAQEFPRWAGLIESAIDRRSHQWDRIQPDGSKTVAETRKFISEMQSQLPSP